MKFIYSSPQVCFGRGALAVLKTVPDCNRVMIVTDASVAKLGVIAQIKEMLTQRAAPCQVAVIDDVELDPSPEYFRIGAKQLHVFSPDTIIAVGGGTAINAAKGMWLLYEHPELDYADLKDKMIAMKKEGRCALSFSSKAKLIAIPATSGPIVESACFVNAVDKSNTFFKYPVVSYDFTPQYVISDGDLILEMPGHMAAETGFNVLTAAIEAYVSVFATDYSDALAQKAVEMIFRNLPQSVSSGIAEAREKVHLASTIAGMAVSNAYTGLCHSITDVLAGEYEMSQGQLNGIFLPHIILYNAVDYEFPELKTDEKYAGLSRYLNLPGDTVSAQIDSLCEALTSFAQELGLNGRLKDCKTFSGEAFPVDNFRSRIEELAMRAYENPCTTATPKHPRLEDIIAIMEAAI